MQTFIYVLHFLVCFILIGVVLLQRGKGQDLGASLGGGGANTIFGSRGAGNFLTKITTASAIVFMCTSLTLSYLGYQSSDVKLFDSSEPFVPAGSAAPGADGPTLEEIPAEEAQAPSGDGGLVEIPSAGASDAAAPAAESASPAAAAAAPEAAPAAETGANAPTDGSTPVAPDSGAPTAAASPEATPPGAKP